MIYHYIAFDFKDGSFGGVPRFDHELHKVFPEMKTISRKRDHINKYDFLDNDIIITDNGLACECPLDIKTIIVHHGMARTHLERNPTWEGRGFIPQQDLMVKIRPEETTWYIGTSKFLADEFKRHYNKEDYRVIVHSVETPERPRPNNIIPKILGDWRTTSKGKAVIDKINFRNNLPYEFVQLQCDPLDKYSVYKDIDIYLCLSILGFGYSLLDAISYNIPIITTTAGQVLDCEIRQDCGVLIPWTEYNNIETIENAIKIILSKYDTYQPRKWLLNNLSFPDWCEKWRQLVSDINCKSL